MSKKRSLILPGLKRRPDSGRDYKTVALPLSYTGWSICQKIVY